MMKAALSKAWHTRIRQGEPDLHLAVMLAIPAERDRLLLALAFHLELEKIRRTVTEPMIALIRYAWWHEAFDAYGKIRKLPLHEFSDLLENALRHYPDLTPWHGLIEAHTSAAENQNQAPLATVALFRLWNALSAGEDGIAKLAERWNRIAPMLHSGKNSRLDFTETPSLPERIESFSQSLRFVLGWYEKTLRRMKPDQYFNPAWLRVRLKLKLFLS